MLCFPLKVLTRSKQKKTKIEQTQRWSGNKTRLLKNAAPKKKLFENFCIS